MNWKMTVHSVPFTMVYQQLATGNRSWFLTGIVQKSQLNRIGTVALMMPSPPAQLTGHNRQGRAHMDEGKEVETRTR